MPVILNFACYKNGNFRINFFQKTYFIRFLGHCAFYYYTHHSISKSLLMQCISSIDYGKLFSPLIAQRTLVPSFHLLSPFFQITVFKCNFE